VVAQYKEHTKRLEDDGLLDTKYVKNDCDMLSLPSYSCIHTLEESPQICMFTKIHNTRLPDDMKINLHHMIRIILDPNIILIRDEQTLHSGAKSTPSSTDPFETLENFRLFFYDHPIIEKKNANIRMEKNALRNNDLNGVAQA